MRIFWFMPAVFALALLGACSMDKPDLRYRDSSLREPLAVPQGLDAPQYSQSMDIPSAGTGSAAPGAQDIELPPDLRAGGPGQDLGAAQDKGPIQEKGPARDQGPPQDPGKE